MLRRALDGDEAGPLDGDDADPGARADLRERLIEAESAFYAGCGLAAKLAAYSSGARGRPLLEVLDEQVMVDAERALMRDFSTLNWGAWAVEVTYRIEAGPDGKPRVKGYPTAQRRRLTG